MIVCREATGVGNVEKRMDVRASEAGRQVYRNTQEADESYK